MRAKEDGSANWTFPTEEDAGRQTTLEDLRLDDVQLTDSMISFQGAEGEAPLMLEDVDASLGAANRWTRRRQLQAAFNYRGERMNVDGEIGLPRAVLEKGETPITARCAFRRRLKRVSTARSTAETGALAGALEANGSSLRRLLGLDRLADGEGGGFGAYSVERAAWRAKAKPPRSPTRRIRLDNINASGNLNIGQRRRTDACASRRADAPRVDLNTYLPAAGAARRASGVEVDTAWSNDPLDLTGLRALDANLDLALGALQLPAHEFLQRRDGAARRERRGGCAADADFAL